MSGCPYCGAKLKRGKRACAVHADLPDAEMSLLDLLCTRSADCTAAVDEHQDDCPVEAELKAVFGF